ncbi:hypothetical protein ETB97_003826 [Aspergillus alliaceus]|uniref:Endo-1,3(4)-beta-glucanase n=1 Tax=Petromyces alliaceus TaxID=209559 RepID=A0A5N7C126_PETAA|nr:hypothetical protein BDV23DRAFT_160259 [Aspergillus alliaceus]KAF5858771.1 hypothetical protein ETB97_003826 [Aspergillus burnettii]
MVLETPQTDPIPATGAEPTNQTDDAPSAKYRYHSLYIKRDLIVNPDPFTLYFGFFGRWNYDRKVTTNILRRVENARVLIQRLPTQDELDAMVTHSSRSVYQERMGAPLGFFGGSAQLFMQARKSEVVTSYFPKLSGEGKMPSLAEITSAARRFVAAEPMVARRAAFVTGFKLLFWSVAGATFSSMYAVYRETRNTVDDPRLKEFLDDLRKQKPEDVRKRQMESRGRRSVAEHHGVVETDQGDDFGSEYSGGDVQSAQASVPDRRPVLEPFGGTGGLSADQSRGGDFFDDDDASPTAPEYRANRGSLGGYSQGSAWERIRQQNAPSVPIQPSHQDPSSQQSPQWDSWNSISDNDKQRERDQARADFERLLDRERNIGQESAGEGQRRGWGKWD